MFFCLNQGCFHVNIFFQVAILCEPVFNNGTMDRSGQTILSPFKQQCFLYDYQDSLPKSYMCVSVCVCFFKLHELFSTALKYHTIFFKNLHVVADSCDNNPKRPAEL